MSVSHDHDMDVNNYAYMRVVREGEVSIPIGAITMLRYWDADGEEIITYHCAGDASLPHTLGMIETVKYELTIDAYGED